MDFDRDQSAPYPDSSNSKKKKFSSQKPREWELGGSDIRLDRHRFQLLPFAIFPLSHVSEQNVKFVYNSQHKCFIVSYLL